ncbi:hypothetical protein TNCV_1548061 [Trichonephila clavipes]|nr:hypothetical protein TNCV_1548061 [Trichonephila clavipes]
MFLLPYTGHEKVMVMSRTYPFSLEVSIDSLETALLPFRGFDHIEEPVPLSLFFKQEVLTIECEILVETLERRRRPTGLPRPQFNSIHEDRKLVIVCD